MQLSTIYLYPNVVEAYTNLDGGFTQERYNMIYSRNLKIYRAVDNRIDLQIKNGDQKKLNLTGSFVKFNLVNKENKDLVLSKDADADDAASGRFYVTLSEAEMRDLEPGNYSYSLVKETRENIDSTNHKVTSSRALYVDSQYGVTGEIEVYGDVYGQPYDTQIIDTFNKVINFDNAQGQRDDDPPFNLPRPNYARHTPISGFEEYFESEIIDAQAHMLTPQSLHTFQIYATSYNGTLKLQGSLDAGGTPIDTNWVDLKEWDLTNDDSLFYHNITGKYNWFRFYHAPAENNTGTVDKILYR